ncbi:putative ribonuclease H-like domain-containing protein [Tanacetum coccineum]
MRTKPGVDSLSFDDLYNNLRVFENDVKGSTASSSSSQNVAFVSENTSSTNDVSTAYSVSNTSGQNPQYEQTSSYSLLANQSSCPQLDHEDLEQLDEYDLEEMDLKWQVAMISMRMKKFYKKTGVDWTSHSEEDEDYALMACNSSESDTEREQLSDASTEIKAYSQGLKKVEATVVAHQPSGQLWYEQKIKFMKIDLDDKTNVLTYHKKLLVEAQKEKEDLKAKVLFTRWNAVVPSTHDGNLLCHPGPDIEVDYSQFTYGPKQTQPSESESIQYESDSEDEETVKNQFTHSQKPKVDKKELGYGFTHMTGNKAYLAEFQDFNGGLVAFGGSKGYITGKGKIKTRKLDFEDVCFVKELQHFNLFSVSQMCDKKNKVLFTDSECLVLSPEFKLPDENQVLLKIPRQNNMYSFNLENIVPSGGLACLIAKATIDESNKWHRRLGHVNFKNLNKLVKGNLVRGLPS